MKKSLLFLFIVGICACNKEGDVRPAQEATFLRYFGNEHNQVAVLALEDNNGFSLLSTEQIETGIAGQIKSKIHFTRTDQYGSIEFERSYPKPLLTDDGVTDTSENRTAASFIALNPGYLIIGNRINSDNTNDLYLLKIDQNGTMLDSAYISLKTPQKPLLSLEGRAIADADPNNPNVYNILGTIRENGAEDMFVAEIRANDLDSCNWKRMYGDVPTTLINRLYLLPNGQNVWGGYGFFNTSVDARIIRVDPDTQPTQIGGNIGSVEFNENALDFSKGVNGWVITGYTNENPADNINPSLTEDIFVMKVNDGSTPLFKKQIQGLEDGTNERGVSITMTSDQNYVVLGTVGTTGQSDDLFIVKINDSGVVVPGSQRKVNGGMYYGGADKQEGASIRETSDGSLLIFGTTYFGNEKKLMLLKVNRNGEL